MNTCPHEEVLHAYTEGWLDAESQQAIEAHLTVCHECQRRVAGWQAVSEAIRGLPRIPAPAGTLQPMPTPHHEWRLVLALSACLAGIAAWLWLAGVSPPELNHFVGWTPYSTLSESAQQAAEKLQPFWHTLREVLKWKA